MKKLNRFSILILICISVDGLHAQVVTGDWTGLHYVVVNATISPPTGSFPFTSMDSLAVDVNGDSIPDVIFYALENVVQDASDGFNFLDIRNQDFEIVYDTPSESITMLNGNQPVNSSLSWYRFDGSNFSSRNFASYTWSAFTMTTDSMGMWFNFTGTGNGFMGFRMATTADTLYGWFHLTSYLTLMSPPFATLSVQEWALETYETGIEETGTRENVYVSPNPFSGTLNIATSDNGISEAVLYDIASRKILSKEFRNALSLNTDQLAKGWYFYEVRGKDGVCRKGKVVKD